MKIDPKNLACLAPPRSVLKSILSVSSLFLAFLAGMDGAGFFPAGRGKGQNLSGRGGAKQVSKSSGRGGAGVKISGAGQNVSISADLDHLLKEGKPLFEYNSII